MNRRRLIAIVTFALPLVAVGAACTFPDVTFGAAENNDAASEDGGVDGGDADSTFDAGDFGDVARRDDANQILDASACGADGMIKCDCDDDEYADMNCDVDAAGIVSKRGNPLRPGDCDDLDGLRHPNAGLTEAIPVGHDGDWDCDGTVEREPKGNIKCSGSGLGCIGDPGFLSEPGCGTKADFYGCEAPGVLAACVATPKGPVTQLCR
ncbi:MAG: hypothetical protein K0S65_244 [Labilithrix sp.]|nr:hypothetical protein [Labilithrix sp.]